MKKSIYLLLILSIVAVTSIYSCSEKDNEHRETESPNKPNDNTKSCWEFTIKVKTSIKGVSMPGYPQTVTSTTKECDLTEKEAAALVKIATTTSSSTVQGITATVESTCTKKRL